ncbi:MAG: rimL [Caulobacteraceae bacterium]|nr:rimL [Caulobacteraceae bacterium]
MSVVTGEGVELRRITARDLKMAVKHGFTLSITEPLSHPTRLREVYDATGFWTDDTGAVAIEARADERLVGALQFYPAGGSIKGYEIGYVIYSEDDVGKGYAIEAIRLFSDLLFKERSACHRLQMLVAKWDDRTARLAEDCGFASEGTLRKAGFGRDGPEDCLIYSRVRD